MATKFDRFLSGGSNWASRFGPAQGVNYFSGGDQRSELPVSGPGNLIEEGTLEPAQRTVAPELFPQGGGGGRGDLGLQPPGRDLLQNPLSDAEMMGYHAAKGVIGAMPFGGIVGAVMDYNLGAQTANTPNVVESMRGNAVLADTYSAGRLAGSFPTSTWGDRAKTAVANSWAGKTFGMESPATFSSGTSPTGGRTESTTYSPMDAWGNPVGPVTVSSVYSPSVTATDLPSMSAAPASNGYDGSGGFNGAGYDAGPTGPSGGYDVGDNGAGGYALADGGMVGLAEPMFGSNSPRTLTQIGFAEGGGVGMQTPAGGNSPEMVNMRVAEMMRNPQVQQMVQQAVGAAMQSGELTPEELVTLGRIAEASIHNPALYPKLRQFAMQQGMAPLPPAFDQRVIMVLMVAARMMGGAGVPLQGTPAGQVPPTSQAQMINPTGGQDGGLLVGPGTGRSDSIGTQNMSTGGPVKVSNGEYVIPAHVVRAKGQDFFDKLLRQYAPLTPEA